MVAQVSVSNDTDPLMGALFAGMGILPSQDGPRYCYGHTFPNQYSKILLWKPHNILPFGYIDPKGTHIGT